MRRPRLYPNSRSMALITARSQARGSWFCFLFYLDYEEVFTIMPAPMDYHVGEDKLFAPTTTVRGEVDLLRVKTVSVVLVQSASFRSGAVSVSATRRPTSGRLHRFHTPYDARSPGLNKRATRQRICSSFKDVEHLHGWL